VTPARFRVLLLLAVVLPLLASAVDLLGAGSVPQPLLEAQQAVNAAIPGSTMMLQVVAAVGLLLLVLAAAGGMFMFRHWGRLLALVSCALAFAAWPLFGYGVYSGWAFGLMELGSTLWGAVIALAFASSVAARFK
jgi:hypothetical protein